MDDVIAEHLDRAVAVAERHAVGPATGAGAGAAAALGLTVSRVDESTGLFDRRYVPSLSVVLRGRKRSIVGDDDQVWGRERFIITPVDLPVVAGVVEAPEGGFVSAVWELDPVVVAEVAGAMVAAGTGGSAGRAAGAPAGAGDGGALPRLGEWTAPLADAFARLLALLDDPADAPVLFPLVSREIVLRLLQTTQAPRILAALDDEGASVVSSAVELLQSRMDEPWSMRRLTRELAVSETTLFTRFKDATGMSPAQFLKRTRLGEARRRMVLHGETAARAAAGVGYRSASHFSRDYREAYGRPPAEDAVRAREELAGGMPMRAAV